MRPSDKIILPSKIVNGRINYDNYEWYGKYVNIYIDAMPVKFNGISKITIPQKAGIASLVDWFDKKEKTESGKCEKDF